MKCLLCQRDIKRCRCTKSRPITLGSKRGQTFLFGFMLSLTIIILALALAFPLRQSADTAMNASTDTNLGMDCSNSSISSFNKITCYAVDLSPFYLVGTLIMIAGIVIGSKIILD